MFTNRFYVRLLFSHSRCFCLTFVSLQESDSGNVGNMYTENCPVGKSGGDRMNWKDTGLPSVFQHTELSLTVIRRSVLLLGHVTSGAERRNVHTEGTSHLNKALQATCWLFLAAGMRLRVAQHDPESPWTVPAPPWPSCFHSSHQRTWRPAANAWGLQHQVRGLRRLNQIPVS